MLDCQIHLVANAGQQVSVRVNELDKWQRVKILQYSHPSESVGDPLRVGMLLKKTVGCAVEGRD